MHHYRWKICTLLSFPLLYVTVLQGAITSMTKALAIDEAIHDIRMNS